MNKQEKKKNRFKHFIELCAALTAVGLLYIAYFLSTLQPTDQAFKKTIEKDGFKELKLYPEGDFFDPASCKALKECFNSRCFFTEFRAEKDGIDVIGRACMIPGKNHTDIYSRELSEGKTTIVKEVSKSFKIIPNAREATGNAVVNLKSKIYKTFQ